MILLSVKIFFISGKGVESKLGNQIVFLCCLRRQYDFFVVSFIDVQGYCALLLLAEKAKKRIRERRYLWNKKKEKAGTHILPVP